MAIKIKLKKNQIGAINKRLPLAQKNGNLSEVNRLIGILMLSASTPVDAICKHLRVSSRTVRDWIKRLFIGGIDGLFDKKRSGRPSKLTKKQRRRLSEIIEKGPEKYGFLSACWRTPLVQQVILETFGVYYNVRYISELLKCMGFSYQRAQVICASRDDDKRLIWQEETLPRLINKAKKKGAYLFYGDECSFPQWTTISYTWAKAGKTPTVKSGGSRKAYKVFGVIDYFTGRFISKGTNERLNSESYIDFLKEILKRTKKHVFLIQDGARYHRSKKVKTFISKNKARLTVETLPAYSPDFNPIEKLWKKIKQGATHLKYFPTFDDLVVTVDEALGNFENFRDEVISLFS